MTSSDDPILLIVDALSGADRIQLYRPIRRLIRVHGRNLAQMMYTRRETGKCPVCGNDAGQAITCGSRYCVSIWTIGYVPYYYNILIEREK